MSGDIDPVLRTRLDRLARAVPVAPERLWPLESVSPRYRGRSGIGVLAAALGLVVLALAASFMGGGGNPPESNPRPSPTPSLASLTDPTLVPPTLVASPVQLPTWPEAHVSGVCPQAVLGGVTLRGDVASYTRPVWVDSRSGEQLNITWPHRFTARFNPALELLNERGEVVARDGDVLDLGGADGRPFGRAVPFYVCTVTRASADPGGSWGPLAVIPPQDGGDVSYVDATLRIRGSCVFLETSGGDTLPIWPDDRTTWSAELRAIAVEEFSGRVVIARDGDFRRFDGDGFSPAESGLSWDAWVRAMDWVAPPARSCLLDSAFVVEQARY